MELSVRFRTFRSRVLTFVLGLLVLVQASVFLAVTTAQERNARLHIDETLELTAAAFETELDVRERILLDKARLLSGDFAFKEACATGEHGTLLSAVENHRDRADASVMMVVSMDGDVQADTLHPDQYGTPFAHPAFLDAAMDDDRGEATSIEFIDGEPHQLVVTPLFTPDPTAWIVIGFPVDDALAEELRRSTGTEISLMRMVGDGWQPFATTLDRELRDDLARRFSLDLGEAHKSIPVELDGREYVTWIAPAESVGRVQVATVLQRSLDDALAPTFRVRNILVGIFGAGLIFSILGGALLASRVTRPVAILARGAERVAEGDYTEPVEIEQRDELGVLADSFNRMTKGLAERDRVRNLLGKVVSPAVAEELLRKEIELGGEERVVSVLFSDVRNFTSLSERAAPHDLVRLLNTYLTRVSAIVEEHGGVVDKFIGDAVMAIFGAPLGHADDALRAVHTAMEMYEALDDINTDLGLSGDTRIGIGVGVSTGVVVAGNMGSLNRLNYTVIGDSVNVASRLEGVTKRYRVGVVVGQSTANACPGIAFRELDRVRVKGRDESLTIYEPLGEQASLAPELAAECRRWEEALESFRARDWDGADVLLDGLTEAYPDTYLYALYRERIAHLRAEPPPPDWDGTITYDEK